MLAVKTGDIWANANIYITDCTVIIFKKVMFIQDSLIILNHKHFIFIEFIM